MSRFAKDFNAGRPYRNPADLYLREDHFVCRSDRYFVESAYRTAKPSKEVNSPALKRQLLDAAKTNMMFIAKTGLAPDNIAAIKFVGGRDNLAGVSRSEIDREVTATLFKTAIKEGFRAVDRLDL